MCARPCRAHTRRRSRRATRHSKGGRDDPGNDDGGGPRPVRGDLLDDRRREAQAARLEGLDRLPRPERGGPGLGDLRLGPGGLEELRLRPRGAVDHAGGRAQEQTAGDGARRPLRRVAARDPRGEEGMSGNAAIVRQGYAALNRGDLTTVAALLGDNVSWHTPGRSPLAGDVVGRDAVFSRLGRYVAETGGTFRSDLKRLLTDEDGRVI